MKSALKNVFVLTLGLTLLSACTTTQPAMQSPTPSFGQAVNHNTAMQAVPATAEQKNNTYTPADYARRELARERYKKDDVEKPKPLRTTN